MAIAELNSVTKRYGLVEALKGVDLKVERGELVALLGPNGAGKTTAVNILLGQRRPDSGTARLFGRNPTEAGARTLVGVTPQQTAFPRNLKVREVVQLVQAHYPDTGSGEQLLERFGLEDLERRSAGGLSGGQQRRLALALAFAGDPKAVFLDEPTTGVDVEARHNLWTGIGSFVDAGGTVLLTTHYLEEAEALASRVVVIDRGSIIAEGSVSEITASVGLSQVRLRADHLPELANAARIEANNGTKVIYTADPDALVQELAATGVSFEGLEISRAGLEEAFLTLTGGHQ
jgi:ABC-2 type transport system ATP-binding protein